MPTMARRTCTTLENPVLPPIILPSGVVTVVFFNTGASLHQFQDRMLAQGIKVGRHFDGYDTWARVTIGLRPEVDRFLAALPGALGA